MGPLLSGRYVVAQVITTTAHHRLLMALLSVFAFWARPTGPALAGSHQVSPVAARSLSAVPCPLRRRLEAGPRVGPRRPLLPSPKDSGLGSLDLFHDAAGFTSRYGPAACPGLLPALGVGPSLAVFPPPSSATSVPGRV